MGYAAGTGVWQTGGAFGVERNNISDEKKNEDIDFIFGNDCAAACRMRAGR